MQRGRTFPQILPRAVSRGLMYNRRLPLWGRYYVNNLQYDGAIYPDFQTGAVTGTVFGYEVLWSGTLEIGGDSGTWQVYWIFDPSDENNYVYLQLDTGVNGTLLNAGLVQQGTSFSAIAHTGFDFDFQVTLIANGKFAPEYPGPYTVQLHELDYHELP